MCSFNSSLFSAWPVPNAVLGCGCGNGKGRQGPLPTLSFYTPPHLYHLSVPPPGPLLSLPWWQQLSSLTLIIETGIFSSGFTQRPPLPLTVFQMLLPLSIDPQIKTL